jgi:hypothetical protein
VPWKRGDVTVHLKGYGKVKNTTVWLVFGIVLTAGAASADSIVYNNDFGGVISGDNAVEAAWPINFGSSLSNSFVLINSASLTGVNLLAWETPGDATTSLNWYILDNGNPTDPFSGTSGVTTIASGTVAPTDTFQSMNIGGWDIDELSFSISTPALTAGTTYWLQIDTAVSANGNSVYWDQSDGPSTAYSNAAGLLPATGACNGLCTGSESFQLLASSSPEPGSLALLGAGFAGLVALRRRKRQA